MVSGGQPCCLAEVSAVQSTLTDWAIHLSGNQTKKIHIDGSLNLVHIIVF